MRKEAKGPVLSFHPMIDGDYFLWDRGNWDHDLVMKLTASRAVILPQTVQGELYSLCRFLCPMVFPNYDLRFQWQGKVGNTLLFWAYNVPHPRTQVFPRVEALMRPHPAMNHSLPALPPFPFVLKAACGGEGKHTWLIETSNDLQQALKILERREWHREFGFVIQEFLPDLERDLRVVVIGDLVLSYWRKSANFLHNIAQGGEIDKRSAPDLQARGRQAVVELCARTGINLAGFDLVFLPGSPEPLFLEINYTFGWTGIGGAEKFNDLLKQAVDRWLMQ